MGRPLVLYHGPMCQDGWVSAWVAWRRYGTSAEYVPVQYGDENPLPDLKGREVFVLDFHYPVSRLRQMAVFAEYLLVLDHHKTAMKDLAGVEADPGVAVTRQLEPNLTVHFDMSKSGARLSWEHFFPLDTKGCWLVDYAEDRDFWRWRHENSKEVSAALDSYPREFEVWDRLHARGLRPEGMASVVAEGRAILRYQEQQVAVLVKHAVETEVGGHKVLAVNATEHMSRVGEELAKGRPFGATYFIRGDGKKVWSLRSREGGIDVGALAKSLGGGGHPQAAGFEEG